MPDSALPWGFGFLRPWVLLALPAVWVLIVFARRPWWPLARASRAGRRRERVITGLRLALATLLVLGLAGMQARRTVREQAVVFALDASASVGPAGAAGAGWVREAIAAKGAADRAGVLSFGAEARVEEPTTAAPAFIRPETLPGRHATDAAAALRLAGAMLPADLRKRVVVLTDGRENRGAAIEEARRLAGEGVRVDLVPLSPAEGPEVMLQDLRVPETAYQGERVNLAVRVRSNVDTPARLRLYRDDALLAEEPVAVKAGEVNLVLSAEAGGPGLHAYRVEVRSERDGFGENNQAAALQRVLGPPQVLIIEGKPGEGEVLRRSLAAGGAGVAVLGPAGMPADLAGWSRYDAVILANVPAKALGEAAMQQLEAYVRDLGHGLAMAGGEDAFGPGGYFDTPVERALPVYMDLRGRARQPTVGLVLVLDKSQSMSVLARGADKMSIAKEAAARAAQVLTPRDLMGVVAFDRSPRWVVPLQPAGDPDRMRELIGSVYPDGGTNIYPALEEAYNALREAPAELKHVIVFSDGFSVAGDFPWLTEEMRKANITLSAVEVSTCQGQCHYGSAGLMAALADLGKGRFYHADDVEEIPSIFTKEAKMAARTYIVNKDFFPAAVSPGPLARGLDRVPPLEGYVAATPKERAEVVLASPDGDPVLAAWQYGLGRAVAWTSDARGRWSAPWVHAPAFPRLWGNILSWLLAEGGAAGRVRVEERDGSGVITVETPVLGGEGPRQAVVVGPGGERREVPLQAIAPGEYRGEFPAPDPGVYLAAVGGSGASQAAGLVIPYSPEYRRVGADQDFLQRLAAAGGGAVLSKPAEAFAANLLPVRRVTDLWPWLFALAAILFPLDVGNRRVDLGAAVRAALARLGRVRAAAEARAGLQEERLAPVGRLKARKAAVRSAVAAPHAGAEQGGGPDGGGRPAGDGGADAPGSGERPPGVSPGTLAGRLIDAKRRSRRDEDVSS